MANEPFRVLRGGGWVLLPSYTRVAYRSRSAPGYRDYLLGVRLIRLINTLQQLAETGNEL